MPFHGSHFLDSSLLTPHPSRFQRKVTPMSLSKDLLDILACPQCKGPVKYSPDAQEICCESCQLAFPVRDDIPVMLIDEARSINEVRCGKSS